MGQRSAASSRAAERSAMMQQKRKVVDTVRGRFARFGDEVLSVVLAFALQPRSMPVLLQRLNMRPAGNLEAQLDAVWEYIAQNSSRDFLKHVKQVKKRDVEAFDINKLLDSAAKDIKVSGEGAAATAVEAPGAEAPAAAEAEAPLPPAPPAEHQGAERRSGTDRRKRHDRRHDIEAINRNRRFGGERRKRPRGRRKSD